MANKTKLEQLDVQTITNNGSNVIFEKGLLVPRGTTIWTGAAGIWEDDSANVCVNGPNFGIIATSDNRNIFNVPNTFNGSLFLPNSPTTPSEATLTDTYSTRITAKGVYDVVDGAETFVTKIQGNTEDTGDALKSSYFKGIESGNKNLFNAEGENDKENDVTYITGAGKVTCTTTSQWGTNAIFFYKTYPAGTYTFSAQSLNYPSYRILFATDTQISGTSASSHYTNIVGQNCYDKVIANTTKYFTFTAESEFRMGIIFYLPTAGGDRTCAVDEILLVSGSTQVNYIPYKGDNGFNYPETLELGKWDYALPQEGKVHKSTILYQFTGTEIIQNKSEVITGSYKQECYYYNVILNNPIAHTGSSDQGIIAKGIQVKHPDQSTIPDIGIYWGGWSNQPSVVFWSKKSVDYWATKEDLVAWLVSQNIWVAYSTEETVFNISPKAPFYIAYPGGNEIVDNGGMGAEVPATITQTYSIHENPTEAANKAYVNNSLATKLDKSGGTITGNLIVEGKTDTALGAIVSKQNGIAYGLAYDGDAYKLGEGTINSENGEFTFNENEGLPITLRDDSSKFMDGELLQWSSDGNKLISSGATLSGIQSQIIGKAEYKGTVNSVADLESKIAAHRADTTNPLVKGDYYIASAVFTVYAGAVPPYYELEEQVHPNDIIIYNGEDSIGDESYFGWYYDYKLDIIHSDDTNNFVTKNTEQTITDKKIFDYTPSNGSYVTSRVIVGGDNLGISIQGNATGTIGSSYDPITKIGINEISMTYYDGARAGTKFTPQNIVYTKTNPDTYTTEDHTISFPAKSGTIALTTDVEENATKIYDSQSGTVKVDSLRIYMDANGYLYIETN